MSEGEHMNISHKGDSMNKCTVEGKNNMVEAGNYEQFAVTSMGHKLVMLGKHLPWRLLPLAQINLSALGGGRKVYFRLSHFPELPTSSTQSSLFSVNCLGSESTCLPAQNYNAENGQRWGDEAGIISKSQIMETFIELWRQLYKH